MDPAQRVRNVDRVMGYFTRKGYASQASCASELGMKRKAVYKAVESLVRKGVLVRDPSASGMYRSSQGIKSDAKPAAMQEKIWRAAKLKKTFTNWDLAFYSEASHEYVKRYLAYLQREGYVSKLGHDGNRILYSIDRHAPHAAPQMTANALGTVLSSLLLDDTVALVRAIMSGDRAKAREAHARIGVSLSGKEAQA